MLIDLGDLRIRPWRRDDLDALLRYADNPRIAGNLRDQFPHPYTRRDALDYLEYVRTQDVRTAFAVEHEGEAVGGIGFRPGHDITRLSAEIGYWLGEPFWGRGFMTRVVKAASDAAFQEYSVVRLFAFVFSPNVASIRVLEKAGFQQDGLMRRSAVKNGEILDQFLFAKVR